MLLGRKKRGAKLKEGQAPATPSPSDSSSAISTPAENAQKISKGTRFLNSLTSLLEFGPTSGRSTRAPTPDPANFTQDDATSSMHTASILPVPTEKLGKSLQQEASDLWTKAYNELLAEDQQDLRRVGNTDGDKPEKLETLRQLLGYAMGAKGETIARQWKLRWGGKEINVREKVEKLAGWITKFKEVMDIAVQCDPVHAGLPWAGVRFILIACSPIESL